MTDSCTCKSAHRWDSGAELGHTLKIADVDNATVSQAAYYCCSVHPNSSSPGYLCGNLEYPAYLYIILLLFLRLLHRYITLLCMLFSDAIEY